MCLLPPKPICVPNRLVERDASSIIVMVVMMMIIPNSARTHRSRIDCQRIAPGSSLPNGLYRKRSERGMGANPQIMSAAQIAMIVGLPYTALRNAILADPTFVEGLHALFSSEPS